jgi:hypothetical protein
MRIREQLTPPSGWSSLVLVTIMLLTVAWSIQSAGWVAGLEVLTLAVIGAVAAGLMLSRLDWMPGPLAHGWGFVIGLVWLTLLGTRILPQYGVEPGYADMTVLARMGLVRDRVVEWIVIARAGGRAIQPEDSQLVFVLATGILLWLLAYVCVRFLVRYVSFWGAVLPSGFALLANLYYAPDTPPTYLILFLLCALLLAVNTSVAIQKEYWRQTRVHFHPDIGLDFLKDGAMVAVAVILLGHVAPAELQNDRLSSFVRSAARSPTVLQSEFDRLFPGIESPLSGSGGAYTDEMSLHGSIDLASVPIFDVRLPAGDDTRLPRYFRMMAFDAYDGGTWRRTAGWSLDEEIALQPPAATVAVTQSFTTFQAGLRQLFAAPQPAAFTIDVERRAAGPDSAPDLLEVESVEPLGAGAMYQAMSHHSVASVAELAAVNGVDPDWVVERYTALPSNAEVDEIEALARKVAGAEATRYAAADRLEDYLRANYTYSEEINEPPARGDRVHWFLFTERRGYCDYYSSAFVVMARSLGIPARVAAGYSRGVYSADRDAYRQYAYDAHSWPEVWFPEYGWIPFEPTAGDSEIARTAGAAAHAPIPTFPAPDAQTDDLLPEEDRPSPEEPSPAASSQGGAHGPAGLPMGLLAGAVLVAGVAYAGARLAWSRAFRGLSHAESAFARLVRLASWFGMKPRDHDTPYEYRGRLAERLRGHEDDLGTITDAYVRERFGGRRDDQSGGAIDDAWRRLKPALARLGVRFGASFVARTPASRSNRTATRD